MSQASRADRLSSLDSLRGLAALIVVFHHSFLSLPGVDEDRHALAADGFSNPLAWVYLTPIRLLIAGHGAVLVFFVLSGLVLGMTFINKDKQEYLPFAVKRFTRIWPTFAVAIAVSALLAAAAGVHPLSGVSTFFNYSWGTPVTPNLFLQSLLMTGSTTNLDLPMWSLIHELRISLLFPLLVAISLWNWRAALLGSVIATFATFALHPHSDQLLSWLGTVRFAFLFFVGISIASSLRPLRLKLAACNRPLKIAMWLIALGGVALSPDFSGAAMGVGGGLKLVGAGVAASLLVLLCSVEGRAFRALLGPLPIYLGRISYSLYLWHMVVITAVVHAFHTVAPTWALVTLCLPMSILIADISQRFIERPSTDLGRALARRLHRRSDDEMTATGHPA